MEFMLIFVIVVRISLHSLLGLARRGVLGRMRARMQAFSVHLHVNLCDDCWSSHAVRDREDKILDVGKVVSSPLLGVKCSWTSVMGLQALADSGLHPFLDVRGEHQVLAQVASHYRVFIPKAAWKLRRVSVALRAFGAPVTIKQRGHVREIVVTRLVLWATPVPQVMTELRWPPQRNARRAHGCLILEMIVADDN